MKILIIIVVSIIPYFAFSQTIKGKVVDENGNPIPGANVYWQNTKIGTTSGNDGKYTIEKPKKIEGVEKKEKK